MMATEHVPTFEQVNALTSLINTLLVVEETGKVRGITTVDEHVAAINMAWGYELLILCESNAAVYRYCAKGQDYYDRFYKKGQ